MKKVILLLFLVLATGCDFVIEDESDGKVKATWLWDVSVLKNDVNAIVDQLKTYEITTLYLFYSTELNQDIYRNFIQRAHSENIKVEALGGEREWGLEKHRKEGKLFIQSVIVYNDGSKKEERFDAIHLDMEPYLLNEWEQKPTEVISDWYENSLVYIELAHKGNLPLNCDLPFWLDHEEVLSSQPKSWKKDLYQLFIDSYDSVNLMSYRNTLLGENSISGISNTEIEYAEKMKKKIILSLDLLPSEIPYTTFNKKSYEYLNTTLSDLNQYYHKKRSYQGVALHDFDHLIKKR